MDLRFETGSPPAMHKFTGNNHRPPRDGKGKAAVDRIILVFSQDESLLRMVADGLSDGWRLDNCREAGQARSFLIRSGVGVVVVDDGAIEETTRVWLLDQVRRWAPQALVAYIASNHSPEVERQARCHSVQYYASRPLDRDRTLRILKSFVGAAR
jgi:DNA-binding NtrC family response regulator